MSLDLDNPRILDVGCGNGWLLQKFSDKGAKKLFGCDFVKNLAFDDFEFNCVDLNEHDLPYNVAMFDIVICSDVLEHLENPSRCIREIRRVVKPEGLVFITIPNCANILQRLYYLLHGNSKRFSPKPNQRAPHISMLTSWIFNYLIKDKFEIKRVGRGWIHFPFSFI
jgi:2-polyprenyl-6-hydroxyphenyl methylase/3-demethylubiquinone-9 3-methyltransferase